MPWKASDVPQLRAELVHLVRVLNLPVAKAARRFGVSRDTAHRWLRRFDLDQLDPLADRSHRPLVQPLRTPPLIEARIIELRSRFPFWGARKIHAILREDPLAGPSLPSIRTVHAVLDRHRLIRRDEALRPAQPSIRFEQDRPNALWQIDHKTIGEVQRQRFEQLTVLDDHSRFLLAIPLCPDKSIVRAWAALWNVFAEFGLPDAILCDNAFGSSWTVPKTLSWFDTRLIRLGVRPVHGRPYHPQTQGKVERLHATQERELLLHARRDSIEHFTCDAETWRRTYNAIRPHESLADRPPLSRWTPSTRPRPKILPEVVYPAGTILRKVSSVGDVRWKRYRLLAGRGLVGEFVRIVEHNNQIHISFADHLIRSIPTASLAHDTLL